MNQDFTISFLVMQSPAHVFAAINNVSEWWGKVDGNTKNLDDVFVYRFKDLHYSRHKVVELIPEKKVVWLVTDGSLSFVQNQTEWIGTKMIFDISEIEGQTQLRFTHNGLLPYTECYKACTGGWTHYLTNGLIPLITNGRANPGIIE